MSENDASCLFLACFLFFAAENNQMFDPLYPYHIYILFFDVLARVYGAA